MGVCVCVCERERDRESGGGGGWKPNRGGRNCDKQEDSVYLEKDKKI